LFAPSIASQTHTPQHALYLTYACPSHIEAATSLVSPGGLCYSKGEEIYPANMCDDSSASASGCDSGQLSTTLGEFIDYCAACNVCVGVVHMDYPRAANYGWLCKNVIPKAHSGYGENYGVWEIEPCPGGRLHIDVSLPGGIRVHSPTRAQNSPQKCTHIDMISLCHSINSSVFS
jgi:hypothetical protein